MYRRHWKRPRRTVLVHAPKASRRRVLMLRVSHWSFPTLRRQNARAPQKKPKNSRGDIAKPFEKNTFHEATTPRRTASPNYGEAVGHAMAHWPDYSELYGAEPCNMFLRQDIFPDVTYAHLPARHTSTRTPEVDPTSRALAASGNVVADAQEFRMCGGNWDLETPLVGSPYEVRELLGRRITTIRSRKWHVAARMGPQDRGGATNYIRRVGETPPAVRRAPPPAWQ